MPNVHDRQALLLAMHDYIGHWDFRATYRVLSDRYWWPSMRSDVAAHFRTCDRCQETKPYIDYTSTQHRLVSGIFDVWSLDLAGTVPRTRNGNRCLLVGVEHLTGWPIAASLPNALSTDVVTFVRERIIDPFESPWNILTDSGRQFTAENTQEFAELNRVA